MAKLLEPELSTRMLRVTTAFNDALYLAANEPSLGMYRIQEHVAVTVPKLVERQLQLQENCQRVEGACYDLEYDTKTLRDMASITQFKGTKDRYMLSVRILNYDNSSSGSIHSLLRAIQLKKQLDEVDTRRRVPLPPQASLPPTYPHPPPHNPSTLPHFSLPPTLPKITPTNINIAGDGADVDCHNTAREKSHEQELSPKSFD